jgi:hypothetical protein
MSVDGVDYAFSQPDIPQLAAAGRPRQSLWYRFWPKVDASGDCWQWIGGVSGRYGMVRPGGSANQRGAHVIAWELLVGPVPEGYQIDHLCKNTLCVNPDHLEPVPPRINLLRSEAWSGVNARKIACPKGHEYTAENTRLYQDKRHCRACDRMRLALRGG